MTPKTWKDRLLHAGSAALLGAALCVTGGCDDGADGFDNTTEEVGDEFEDAGDEIDDTVDDVNDEFDEGVDEIKDEFDDATRDGG